MMSLFKIEYFEKKTDIAKMVPVGHCFIGPFSVLFWSPITEGHWFCLHFLYRNISNKGTVVQNGAPRALAESQVISISIIITLNEDFMSGFMGCQLYFVGLCSQILEPI